MIQSRSIITGPTFISLGLMGAFFACWGTTLPALRSFLQIDIEKAAMLTAYGQASHSVTCLLGGILSDLFRRDKVLMAGCLVLGSGVIPLGSSNSFAFNVSLVLWMGVEVPDPQHRVQVAHAGRPQRAALNASSR